MPVREIGEYIANVGGEAILVGGSVRDYLINLPRSDYDIEV